MYTRAVPRRLLGVAGYGRQPCNEDRIGRTKPSAADGGDAGPGEQVAGSRGRNLPPAPLARPRASMDGPRNIPGVNN
jgi:hypothetical protein